jgi:enterochelin esterase family protein
MTVVLPAPIEPEITSILGFVMFGAKLIIIRLLRTTLPVLVATPFLIAHAFARTQDAISSVAVETALASGESREYVISAGSGEYVSVAVESKGISVEAQVMMPDGAPMRRFTGPPEGRLGVSFVAERGGRYRLGLTGRGSADRGQVSVRITERLSLEERTAVKPSPVKGAFVTALEQQLTSGAVGDTTAFWDRVAAGATPIVEPLPDRTDSVHVTFLWRGAPDTKNVVVVGSLSIPPGFRYNVMSRLRDTDVWFLTKRLPAGARFTYGFAINGPLTFEGPPLAYMAANRQADPFNPVKAGCGLAGTRFDCLSVAELPGAAPQPWIVSAAGIPKGAMSGRRIKSEKLQNERSLSIYTPAAYDTMSTDHDLLLLFDEAAYLGDIPAATILDNLIAARRIRPVVAVLIGNVNRDRELTANADFAAFIADELVPWVRANYRVTADSRRMTIGGSSLGGLAAAYVAMRYPKTFGNVVSLSGAFWWAPDASPGDPANAAIEPGWLTREYLRRPRLPVRFWMAAGTFETDPTGSGGAILESSRHLRDVLLAKGYDVQYVQFPGGHDALSWRGLLPDALMALAPAP